MSSRVEVCLGPMRVVRSIPVCRGVRVNVLAVGENLGEALAAMTAVVPHPDLEIAQAVHSFFERSPRRWKGEDGPAGKQVADALDGLRTAATSVLDALTVYARVHSMPPVSQLTYPV